ncbi:hypothetical protein SAMN02745126_01382 [Enhydrobacter aerosaccus]|uniref:Uncharacterized protein n=1 Tax=Enhydrobacter aerosaccus TaxID=225324 RepID=A0A1T4L7A9_9HYPH|nr:hypothetical protein [Enhydrobacter aerosaccus]SJZ50401.1 hypothetical protein SAMN02745126_01382 [Enhydrobacter aerosaccus]
MKMRAARLRNLFLLIAIFASIAALGSWQNAQNMRRVLTDGYRAVVQVTGAQYQRLSPIAIEGWRPRFVEQSLSVNLKWDGKDGKSHEYRNVPITEAFAGTIVSGNEVKLAILPAKVLDDELAVPVIEGDARARFSSLQDWLRGSIYVAFASWLAFGAMTVWLAQTRRTMAGGASAAGKTAEFPTRLVLPGLAALLVGAVLTIQAWAVVDEAGQTPEAGNEIVAEITNATTLSSGPGAGKHVVQLSWKDARGGVHHFGPVTVSDAFWNKITENGQLTTRQTRIRSEGEGIDARPIIVDDVQGPGWQGKVVLGIGLLLMAAGAVCLAWAVRIIRRAA